MKRFLILCFTLISLLCYSVSHSQAKTNGGTPPDASPPVTESQNPTDSSPESNQKKAHIENNDVIRDQSAPMIKRISELARKTNWTLALSFLALAVSIGSLLIGRESVAVTRDIGQKQTKAYLSVKSALLWVPVLSDGEKGWSSKNKVFDFTLAAVFENTGNTPAYNVSYRFKITLFGGGENLLVSDFGNAHSFGVVGHKCDTSGALTYVVSTKAPTGSAIDPIRTITVRSCYVTIRAEYSDVFGGRWFIESTFEGAPNTASDGASNVKDLVLDHQFASDKQGKIKQA